MRHARDLVKAIKVTNLTTISSFSDDELRDLQRKVVAILKIIDDEERIERQPARRIGRNPRTGEPMKPIKIPKFWPRKGNET